jgi:hypothetical protein
VGWGVAVLDVTGTELLLGTGVLGAGAVMKVEGELEGTGVYWAFVVGTCTAMVEYLEAAADEATGVLPAPEPTVAVPVAVMAEVVCVMETAPVYMAGPGTAYEAIDL